MWVYPLPGPNAIPIGITRPVVRPRAKVYGSDDALRTTFEYGGAESKLSKSVYVIEVAAGKVSYPPPKVKGDVVIGILVDGEEEISSFV